MPRARIPIADQVQSLEGDQTAVDLSALSGETVPLVLPSPLLALYWVADELDPNGPNKSQSPILQQYQYDPVGFANDLLDWTGLDGLTEYQAEILADLGKPGLRQAVRGPHTLGKTAMAAISILWFALTRDGRYDWKAITTASVWRQLEKYLWPEVHKWARRLRWDLLGRPPFNKRELLTLELHLRTGKAFAVASDDPGQIEGAHADQLLYIFDEAKIIPTASWDAIEGAFSGAGPGTKSEVYVLAISTPGDPNGRFYEIHARRPGLEDWQPKHVTKEQAIAAGRMGVEWANQRLRQWGENSIMYQNRVLGNFAQDALEGVIPLTWAEEAMARWTDSVPTIPDARAASGARPVPLTGIGVDVARYGGAATVIACRYANWYAPLVAVTKYDTVEVASVVEFILNQHGRRPYVAVDVIGIGAGVTDMLIHAGYDAWGFNAAGGTEQLDLADQIGFINKRAAAWWTLREILNPVNGFNLMLPPDEELLADLTSPHWRVSKRTGPGGQPLIQVEEKAEIKKRLGRSTDRADAVVMAIALRDEDAPAGMVLDDRVVISPV